MSENADAEKQEAQDGSGNGSESSAALAAVAELGPARRLLGQVISDEASPSFFKVRFRVEANRVTAPGRFVGIDAESESGAKLLILARVDDVHEVNPHEDPLSSTLRQALPFGTR